MVEGHGGRREPAGRGGRSGRQLMEGCRIGRTVGGETVARVE